MFQKEPLITSPKFLWGFFFFSFKAEPHQVTHARRGQHLEPGAGTQPGAGRGCPLRQRGLQQRCYETARCPPLRWLLLPTVQPHWGNLLQSGSRACVVPRQAPSRAAPETASPRTSVQKGFRFNGASGPPF